MAESVEIAPAEQALLAADAAIQQELSLGASGGSIGDATRTALTRKKRLLPQMPSERHLRQVEGFVAKTRTPSIFSMAYQIVLHVQNRPIAARSAAPLQKMEGPR